MASDGKVSVFVPNESRQPKAASRRPQWLALLFWVLFGAGLLVQVIAPRLKIERNAFVIPPSMVSTGKQFHPAEIVSRERRMQVISAILTLGGALGLAVQYRHSFVRRQAPD